MKTDFFKSHRADFSGGQAALIAVIFFLLISLAIMFGFAALAFREEVIVRNDVQAKQSYFLAEAGVEDVVYRIMTGTTYDAGGESLTLNGSTATTIVTSGVNNRTVTATGDPSGYVRKVSTILGRGFGTAGFPYGAQVGYLGFRNRNSPVISGDVFSNGSIFTTDAQNMTVNGDVKVASTTALDIEQRNLETIASSTTPPLEYKLRTVSGQEDSAQSLTPNITGIPTKIGIYVKKKGSPTATLNIRIVPDDNGEPDNSGAVAQTSIDNLTITGSYEWIYATFLASADPMYFGNKYWIVFDLPTGSDSSNYYLLGGNTGSHSGEFLYTQSWVSGSATWLPPSNPPGPGDIAFKLFLGDFSPYLEDTTVNGDAYADTILTSSVSGLANCRADGGGNSFTGCPAPYTPISPLSGPISEADIDAEVANITANSNCANFPAGYTCSGSGLGSYINEDVFLDNDIVTVQGPVKINGDLRISSGSLTLNRKNGYGNIYVTGTVRFQNDCDVRLGSSYNGLEGGIIADGTMIAENNCVFTGSGHVNGSGDVDSFFQSISRAQRSFNSEAIQVKNNVAGGIFYASEGVLSITNNPVPNAVFGQGLDLYTNASIDYLIGLADGGDGSGSGQGGWSLESWREIE